MSQPERSVVRWTASQTVGGSACVHSTRWRACAGISTQSPGFMSRLRSPSSKRSCAAPASSTTNSSSGWSYQKPGGLAWPVETMRSMRTLGPPTSRSTCSSARCPGRSTDRPARRLPWVSFFTVGGTICYGEGMSTDLPFQTAKQLASAIRKKKIGCVELLDLYLKRVEAHNPALNAIIAMDVEGARKRAKAADKAVKAGKKLGPLHGVPMTIKESYNVVGFPTTWGVPALKDNRPKSNALVVQRMLDAG